MKKPIIIDLVFVVLALSFFLLRMYVFLDSWTFPFIILLALVTAFSSQFTNYVIFRKQFGFERYVKGFFGVSIVICIGIIVMAFLLAMYTLHFTEQGTLFSSKFFK